MLMEGTAKYFWLLFLVFLIVYIAVKLSLGVLLKRAKEKAWKAYVPIYTTYVIVDLLNLKKKYFWLSLIPFVNLYYLNIIIQELLKGFNLDPKSSIWYVIFPMYNFPKLAFIKPKFTLNEYALTEEFVKTENILFEKPKEIEEPKVEEAKSVTPVEQFIQNKGEDQAPTAAPANNVNLEAPNEAVADSVFTNNLLEPDKSHTTYVEAQQEAPKEEKPIITPAATGRPKMCPKCGARLAPDANVCFLCGTKL